MKENSLNVVKEIEMQVQEAQKVPKNMVAKKPTPRHIIIKMPKVGRSGASGQDGGIGRHTVPPPTTKRRTTAI